MGIFRDRAAGAAIFSKADYQIIENRLGRIAMFNPRFCDNLRYDLNLSIFEDRVLLEILLEMMRTEGPLCIVMPCFGQTKGTSLS